MQICRSHIYHPRTYTDNRESVSSFRLPEMHPGRVTAIGRYFAEEWGIDRPMNAPTDRSELMYWPTTRRTVNIFRRLTVNGRSDKYLSVHPSEGLQSSSNLAVKAKSERQPQRNRQTLLRRTCVVQDAIHKFLPDIYAAPLWKADMITFPQTIRRC